MGDIIIRALSSSQAQAATAPPASSRTPSNPEFRFRFSLGLGPGSAAAASGAGNRRSPRGGARRATTSVRAHPLVRQPHAGAVRRARPASGGDSSRSHALLALFTYAGRPLEAEETAARLWDTLRAATFPEGLGKNSQTLSALRVQYASMVRLAAGASVINALRRAFPLERGGCAFPVAHAARAGRATKIAIFILS